MSHSLKYACAEFLIANSLNYYSAESEGIDSIEAILAGIINSENRWGATNEQLRKWGGYSFADAKQVRDVESLHANILVDNIDKAVEALRARPWNSGLSLSDFMQLILPYRVVDERLSDWRGIYANKYGILLDSIYDGDDALEACSILLEAMKEEGSNFNDQFHTPHHSATWLLSNRVGNCRDGCDRMLYAMRACGIPVTTDHILGSPENGASHQWMAIRDNKTGNYFPFDDGFAPDRNSSEPYDSTRLKGKVYRKVFGYDGESGKIKFPHPSYIDVSAEYFGENEARVPLGKKSDEVYLGVFCNGLWRIIGMGKRVGNECVFRNVEPGIFYTALSKRKDGKEGYEECSYPFTVLADGSTHVFDGGERPSVSARITRKRMLNTRMLQNWMSNDMVGCKLTLSNGEALDHSCFTHVIREGLNNNRLVVKPASTTLSRYMMYESPLDHIGVAELSVMSGGKAIEYKVISPEPIDGVDFGLINDGLAVTHLRIPSTQRLVVDFGNTVEVDSIIIVPRNDDNFVWPGDKYELYAHHGAAGWKSLGQKVAADTVLMWDVPDNSLLWLRNLTRGREEQPFIMKDGEQWFTLKFRIKPFSWAL